MFSDSDLAIKSDISPSHANGSQFVHRMNFECSSAVSGGAVQIASCVAKDMSQSQPPKFYYPELELRKMIK